MRGISWSPIIDGFHPTSVLQIDNMLAWVSMPIEVDKVVEKYQGSIRFRKIYN